MKTYTNVNLAKMAIEALDNETKELQDYSFDKVLNSLDASGRDEREQLYEADVKHIMNNIIASFEMNY